MKNLSKWAKNNPKSSRLLIVFSHVLVFINSIFFGLLLYVFNWGETKWLLVVAANLFFISFFFYPRVNKGSKKTSYLRQKAHDFSLVFLYSMVISLGINNFLVSNTPDRNLTQQPIARFIVHTPHLEYQNLNQKKSKSVFIAKLKHIGKKIQNELLEIKEEIKRKMHKVWVSVLQFILMLFTLFGGFWLARVIAGFACQIACSGSPGLAWVISIVGWLGILWLVFIILKSIFNHDWLTGKDSETSKSTTNI